MPTDVPFAGVDANHGVYTTANGAYIVDLNTFTGIKYLEGSKGSGTTGMSAQCGAAVTEGDYIFVINIKDGVLVYSKADYSFIKKSVPGTYRFRKVQGWLSVGFGWRLALPHKHVFAFRSQDRPARRTFRIPTSGHGSRPCLPLRLRKTLFSSAVRTDMK